MEISQYTFNSNVEVYLTNVLHLIYVPMVQQLYKGKCPKRSRLVWPPLYIFWQQIWVGVLWSIRWGRCFKRAFCAHLIRLHFDLPGRGGALAPLLVFRVDEAPTEQHYKIREKLKEFQNRQCRESNPQPENSTQIRYEAANLYNQFCLFNLKINYIQEYHNYITMRA